VSGGADDEGEEGKRERDGGRGRKEGKKRRGKEGITPDDICGWEGGERGGYSGCHIEGGDIAYKHSIHNIYT
jgi:hypothetical protein